MIGSDRMRFCGQCNLNVYNLSAMTRDQAESVIAANEGRLCVRFYRRVDGSILTRDCPVGLRAVRRRLSYLAKALVAAGFTFLASIGIHLMLPDAIVPPRQPLITGRMVRQERPSVDVVVSTPLPPDVLPIVGEVGMRKPSRPRGQKMK
jgi:hypothetical protein